MLAANIRVALGATSVLLSSRKDLLIRPEMSATPFSPPYMQIRSINVLLLAWKTKGNVKFIFKKVVDQNRKLNKSHLAREGERQAENNKKRGSNYHEHVW